MLIPLLCSRNSCKYYSHSTTAIVVTKWTTLMTGEGVGGGGDFRAISTMILSDNWLKSLNIIFFARIMYLNTYSGKLLYSEHNTWTITNEHNNRDYTLEVLSIYSTIPSCQWTHTFRL